MLFECETRQKQFAFEVPIQTNLVQQALAQFMLSSTKQNVTMADSCMTSFSHRGGYGSYYTRGWSSRGHPQHQLYGWIGHVAQRCYYRFDRPFKGFSMVNRLSTGGYNPISKYSSFYVGSQPQLSFSSPPVFLTGPIF
ncbi:hypothetical protein PVK06_027641 [Gossypium arboreum]|uniref:Uncharacterized protein n=1 Tax=Gossypium arboreum TaxID=29729 RepID=A0ABR0P0T3_GOSAR|nr:hypothetical protein PVK06_027641 [Gossypium arboreum]